MIKRIFLSKPIENFKTKEVLLFSILLNISFTVVLANPHFNFLWWTRKFPVQSEEPNKPHILFLFVLAGIISFSLQGIWSFFIKNGFLSLWIHFSIFLKNIKFQIISAYLSYIFLFFLQFNLNLRNFLYNAKEKNLLSWTYYKFQDTYLLPSNKKMCYK